MPVDPQIQLLLNLRAALPPRLEADEAERKRALEDEEDILSYSSMESCSSRLGAGAEGGIRLHVQWIAPDQPIRRGI